MQKLSHILFVTDMKATWCKKEKLQISGISPNKLN